MLYEHEVPPEIFEFYNKLFSNYTEIIGLYSENVLPTRRVQEQNLAAVRSLSKHRGIADQRYVVEVGQRFTEMIQRADVWMRIGQNSLKSAMRDGRFKNLFELHRSPGAVINTLKWRRQREFRALGIPLNTSYKGRPCYAYLSGGRNGDPLIPLDFASTYGDLVVKLDSVVKQSATVCHWLKQPQLFELARPTIRPDPAIWPWLLHSTDPTKYASFDLLAPSMELQLYGNVSTRNIIDAVVPIGEDIDNELSEMLADQRVPIRRAVLKTSMRRLRAYLLKLTAGDERKPYGPTYWIASSRLATSLASSHNMDKFPVVLFTHLTGAARHGEERCKAVDLFDKVFGHAWGVSREDLSREDVTLLKYALQTYTDREGALRHPFLQVCSDIQALYEAWHTDCFDGLNLYTSVAVKIANRESLDQILLSTKNSCELK